MPHNPPIIGVSTAVQKTSNPEAKRRNEEFYHEAVRKAGGVPRHISNLAPSWEAEIEKIDGLLIIGGVDVEPERYGDERRPETYTNTAQDDYDFSLVNTCRLISPTKITKRSTRSRSSRGRSCTNSWA